jgi:hypothetical protein
MGESDKNGNTRGNAFNFSPEISASTVIKKTRLDHEIPLRIP